MTAEPVAFVLDALASVVANQPSDHALRRVDRDHSQVYEGSATVDMSTPVHQHSSDLETSNLVGARSVSEDPAPIGTEYDHDLQTVVGVRLEGADGGYGHIDPTGSDGVEWETLKQDVREAILALREYPDAGRTDVSYTHLSIANQSDTSSDYADYYRMDFDVLFDGFESLP